MIRLIMLSAAVLLAVAAIVTFRQTDKVSSDTHINANEIALAVQGPVGRDEPKQLVRVWVHGDGLYPDVVKARPGVILLKAENQTQSDIALIVERLGPNQTSQRLARLGTVNKARRVDQVFTLSEGEYVFYAESQLQYKGLLIVEPRKE